MLDPNQIIPAANLTLSYDIDRWIEKCVYGIDRCPKSFDEIYANFLILNVLANNPTTAIQQCLLSRLLANGINRIVPNNNPLNVQPTQPTQPTQFV